MEKINHFIDVIVLAAELGLKKGSLEGNSKNVLVTVTVGVWVPLNPSGSLFRDIFRLCVSFVCFDFSFVRRE